LTQTTTETLVLANSTTSRATEEVRVKWTTAKTSHGKGSAANIRGANMMPQSVQTRWNHILGRKRKEGIMRLEKN
jgi:hypothetical protein